MKRLIFIFFILSAFLSHGQFRDGMEESINDTSLLKKVQSELPRHLQSDNVQRLADSYRAIGNYFYRKWHSDSLIHYFRKALEQYEILKDSFHIAYCYYRLGEETFSEGNSYNESLNWHLPAASYFERNGDYKMAAHSFYALSTVYKKLDQPFKGELSLQKARSLASAGKDTLLEIIILSSQCDERVARGQWNEYASGVERVLYLARLIHQPVFIKKGLVDNARARLHFGQPGEALKFLAESVAFGGSSRKEVPETYRLLSVAHLRLKNFEEAEKFLALYKHVSDSIQLVKESDNFREMIVKYESDQKKNTIASLERENTLKEKLASNQRDLILILLGCLLLISGVGIFYFQNLAKRRRLQKKLLLQEEKFKSEMQEQKEQQLVTEFSKQLAEVQLTALNAQMNPHFIFNCMNSIQKYILKNEKNKALEFLQNFSELMRRVLDNSVKTKVSLDEEINMLEKYVLLERQRLDNKFDYQIDVDPDLQADFFEIPGMIIQPYVENAIWHGLMNLAEQNGEAQRSGMLKLGFSKEHSTIKCVVEDNGVGRNNASRMEQGRSPMRRSYGMTIANKRLELLQKEDGKLPEIEIEDLFLNNEPAGTRVTVYINID
jgi:hypothetical protein